MKIMEAVRPLNRCEHNRKLKFHTGIAQYNDIVHMYELMSKNGMSWHNVWNHSLRDEIIEWVISLW
jgi:hypothetical protein